MYKLLPLIGVLVLTGCVKARPRPENIEWGAYDTVEIAQMRCKMNPCPEGFAKAERLDDLCSCNKYVYMLTVDTAQKNYHILGVDPRGEKTDYGIGVADYRGEILHYEPATGEMSPFHIILEDYGPAESADFYLLSMDYEEAAHVRITPHPIILERDGYRVRFDRLDHLGHDFMMKGCGFEPGELVFIYSNNNGAIKTYNVLADANGEIESIVQGWVPGTLGGVNKLEITGSSGTVDLQLPWGKEYWKSQSEFVRGRIHAETETTYWTKPK